MSAELNAQQVAEMQRMKSYFPYRIVFGVIDKDTGQFEVWAKPTMHAANRLVREGHAVFMLTPNA